MTTQICSWCLRDIQTGRKLTEQEYKETTKADSNVSHGMCQRCMREAALRIEHSNMEQAQGKLTERHK